jgi:hypothetical protein
MTLFKNIVVEAEIKVNSEYASFMGGFAGRVDTLTPIDMDTVGCVTTFKDFKGYNWGLIGNFRTDDTQHNFSNLMIDLRFQNSATLSAFGGLFGGLSGMGSTLALSNFYAAINAPGMRYSSNNGLGAWVAGGLPNWVTLTRQHFDGDINGLGVDPGVQAETTIAMKKKATYVGWDFDTIWSIKEGKDYPRFKFASQDAGPAKIDIELDSKLVVSGAEIRAGAFKKIKATAVMPDGSKAVITDEAEIKVLDTTLVTVKGNKLSGVKVGYSTLQVSYEGYTEETSLEVFGPDKVEIKPLESPLLRPGRKLRLRAYATYRDKFKEDLALFGKWVSSQPLVVSTTQQGVISALKMGEATITVGRWGVTDSVDITAVGITPPEIYGIDLNSATAYIYVRLPDPVLETTYLKATAYADKDKTQEIASTNIQESPQDFRVTYDEGIHWKMLDSGGFIPESQDDLYCIRLLVGPRHAVSITASAALIGSNEEVPDDTFPPVLDIKPPTGIYSKPIQIVITASEPSTIYYTLDGSAPSEASAVYKGPIDIVPGVGEVELRCYGIDALDNPSEIYEATYVFDITPPIVSASLEEGEYAEAQQIELEMNELGEIYYTLDGSDPSKTNPEGFRYEGPIYTVAGETTILRFIGYDLAGNVSAIETRVYTSKPEVEAGPGTSLDNPLIMEISPEYQYASNADGFYTLFITLPNLDVGQKYKFNTYDDDNFDTMFIIFDEDGNPVYGADDQGDDYTAKLEWKATTKTMRVELKNANWDVYEYTILFDKV